MKRMFLEVKAGITIFASTGMNGNGYADRMSTLHFYKASKGSKIRLLNLDYYFNVATYSLDFDDKYIYTYSYQQEQNWTTYNNDLSGDTYRQEDYIFHNDIYFRICLKRVDGMTFSEEEAKNIDNILLFVTNESELDKKAYFWDEIIKTINTVKKKFPKNL